jgi:hypothetical protein
MFEINRRHIQTAFTQTYFVFGMRIKVTRVDVQGVLGVQEFPVVICSRCLIVVAT